MAGNEQADRSRQAVAASRGNRSVLDSPVKKAGQWMFDLLYGSGEANPADFVSPLGMGVSGPLTPKENSTPCRNPKTIRAAARPSKNGAIGKPCRRTGLTIRRNGCAWMAAGSIDDSTAWKRSAPRLDRLQERVDGTAPEAGRAHRRGFGDVDDGACHGGPPERRLRLPWLTNELIFAAVTEFRLTGDTAMRRDEGCAEADRQAADAFRRVLETAAPKTCAPVCRNCGYPLDIASNQCGLDHAVQGENTP